MFHSATFDPKRAAAAMLDRWRTRIISPGCATTFANAAERGAAVQDSVAEKMRAGLSYSAAWNAVERERPGLFAGMKTVEIINAKR